MDKKAAKRYIISAVAIFCVGFAVICIIVSALCASGKSSVDLSQGQILLLSLVCSLIPTGSFTGFCSIFLKIGELNRNQLIAMVVFCIPLVIFAAIYGIVILIPYFIKAVTKIVLDK